MEWHAARSGWLSYANNFPTYWPGSDLIVGSSTGMPIKRGVVEEIGATTPISKGKEKKVKKEAGKKSKAKEGTEPGQGTKKRRLL